MAANKYPGVNAGYAAPLEGTDSKIRPMLQDGYTALTKDQVASLTASSGAQGPTTANPAADIASPANKANPSPTVANAPAPPRPRDLE
jgi:hypothetical protein